MTSEATARRDHAPSKYSPRTQPRSAAVSAVHDAVVTDIIHAAPHQSAKRNSILNRVRGVLKRVFDIGASTLGLVVLFPLLAIIWLAVLATSPGPPLHTSLRIGRYGRPFKMPKFRTMHVGGPECPREQLADVDGRLTLIGRVLRRTGLDELPQLVSVLRGDMSLVGPRPLLVGDPGATERENFPDALGIRPGISGLAQVSGRNLVSPRRKARLDAFYARKPSLRFDVLLLARTVLVILTGKGFL